MRTNRDGERLEETLVKLSSVDAEPSVAEEPADVQARSVKGSKARAKRGPAKSVPPKSIRSKAVAKAAEETRATSQVPVASPSSPAPELTPPARGRDRVTKSAPPPRSRKSFSEAARQGSPIGPKSRSAPTSIPVPAEVAPANESGRESTPVSRDPRTTLRDHVTQKSAAAAVRAAVAREDEVSIPPATGEPAADLADRFFAEGEAAARAAHAEALQPKVIVAPEAFHVDARAHYVLPERRRKLTNYVKAAVAFSALLCFAGIVSRAAHLNGAGGAAGERSAAAAQIPAPLPAPVPAPSPVAPVVAAPTSLPVDAVPPPPPEEEVAAEPAAPAKSAKEEKEDARKALEHGKRKDAIDAAQRSVDLDPTDAEAWLILGSAQQDSGHWKEARESFVACTKQAKGGAINECRMMLR